MDYSLVRSDRWEGRRGRDRGKEREEEEEEGRKEDVRRMENCFENVASKKCLQKEANQPQKGKAFIITVGQHYPMSATEQLNVFSGTLK